MGHTAIRVENLSKRYRIGERKSYGTLRDVLAGIARSPLRRFRSRDQSIQSQPSKDGFIWALKDVSFEVQQGEVIGIIGRNGAGKSTLLKILSRITKPTQGMAEIHGRVGSLLEVGTGFHPELTGRENIYLNGAILGMQRAEIERKFDEIVDFAEIEKFLDTPVKRYSSGMHMRLAFAVAAHLEPEILLIDEVLAVGDLEFQKKCLGKIEDITKVGRTVLFVSHNLNAVRSLCSVSLIINTGEILRYGNTEKVIDYYRQLLENAQYQNITDRNDRAGRGKIRVNRVEILSNSKEQSVEVGDPASFIFYLSDIKPALSCAFTIYNERGTAVTHFDSGNIGKDDKYLNNKEFKFICRVNNLYLLPGHYYINIAVRSFMSLQDHIEYAMSFDVHEGKNSSRQLEKNKGHGDIYFEHDWEKPNKSRH
jgi:lipopolysaccharide transport system ATP-binding protein